MRGRHRAGVVVAVREIEGVSDLVYRFLDEPLHQDAGVMRQAIELLLQPVERDDCARAAHLRLAENKSQNGNVEVRAGHAEHAPRTIGGIRLHDLQELGGMMLSAFGMEGELWIEPLVQNPAGNAEGISERGSQTP